MSVFLPIILGVMAVLQGGINRKIAFHFGVGGATLINTIVLLSFCLLFIYFKQLETRWPFQEFRLWYLLPGFFGLCLVAGIPFSIAKWGATLTFLWIITAQIFMGGVWDYFVEGTVPGVYKIAGSLLVVIGSWIAML